MYTHVHAIRRSAVSHRLFMCKHAHATRGRTVLYMVLMYTHMLFMYEHMLFMYKHRLFMYKHVHAGLYYVC